MIRYVKLEMSRWLFVILAICIAASSMLISGCATQSTPLSNRSGMSTNLSPENDNHNTEYGDFPLEPEFFGGGDGIGAH